MLNWIVFFLLLYVASVLFGFVAGERNNKEKELTLSFWLTIRFLLRSFLGMLAGIAMGLFVGLMGLMCFADGGIDRWGFVSMVEAMCILFSFFLSFWETYATIGRHMESILDTANPVVIGSS